jgi:AraC-like DNA-binding protein
MSRPQRRWFLVVSYLSRSLSRTHGQRFLGSGVLVYRLTSISLGLSRPSALAITNAKGRLLRSNVTVAEAASTIGFTNVGHFRRLFFRQFGLNRG